MLIKHKEIQILQYNQEFLYNIVADVSSYPEFIPWVSDVRVLTSYDNTIEYEICVDFKVIKEKFSTKDVFYKYNKIEISLIKGPFKTLNNCWSFKSIDYNTTEITFEIEFEFKSKIIAALFSKLFVEAQKKILNSFNKRAEHIYRKNKND